MGLEPVKRSYWQRAVVGLAILTLTGCLPTADAATTRQNTDYHLTGVGEVTVYVNGSWTEGDAASLRNAADQDRDGDVSATETSQLETIVLQSQKDSGSGQSSPRTFLDGNPYATIVPLSVSFHGLEGPVTATAPVIATYVSKGAMPNPPEGDSHTFRRITNTNDSGPWKITVPPGYLITDSKGLASAQESSDGRTVEGVSDGISNIEVTFMKDDPTMLIVAGAIGVAAVFVVALVIRRRKIGASEAETPEKGIGGDSQVVDSGNDAHTPNTK